jgi:4-carboxymuconolactone decarboxylase
MTPGSHPASPAAVVQGRRHDTISQTVQDTLRNLAVGDGPTIRGILGSGGQPAIDGLDGRTIALLRLAALVAVGGDATSYEHETSAALAGGATADQVVGVLLAIGSITGSSRLIAAAGQMAVPIGYDVDADLEALPTTWREDRTRV